MKAIIQYPVTTTLNGTEYFPILQQGKNARILASLVMGAAVSIIAVEGVNADTTLASIIPIGYKLLSVDTYSDSLVTISIGTTPGGDNVMSGVDCNGCYSIDPGRKWFSKTVAQTLYITSAAWPTTVDFFFSIQKIV
jgi:hypothetical protein